MSALNGISEVALPIVATKPRRPRPDGLTYSTRELAYVIGLSVRQVQRLKHKLPAPLPFSRRPLWSRTAIQEWLESGAKSRR
jgi:hypothetical protein